MQNALFIDHKRLVGPQEAGWFLVSRKHEIHVRTLNLICGISVLTGTRETNM